VPTYQYACTACDHRFEAVQSFTDASLTECPACSGTLRKVFSSVGIVFKGSGFYRTDSRSGGGGVASESAKSDSSSSSSNGSSSSKESSSSSSNGSSSSSSSSAPAAAAS
jgi:putative FmdB family regulatory protein